MSPIKCPRCKGKGKVRKSVDPETAWASLGVFAVIDKLTMIRCPSCNGRGYIR